MKDYKFLEVGKMYPLSGTIYCPLYIGSYYSSEEELKWNLYYSILNLEVAPILEFLVTLDLLINPKLEKYKRRASFSLQWGEINFTGDDTIGLYKYVTRIVTFRNNSNVTAEAFYEDYLKNKIEGRNIIDYCKEIDRYIEENKIEFINKIDNLSVNEKNYLAYTAIKAASSIAFPMIDIVTGKYINQFDNKPVLVRYKRRNIDSKFFANKEVLSSLIPGDVIDIKTPIYGGIEYVELLHINFNDLQDLVTKSLSFIIKKLYKINRYVDTVTKEDVHDYFKHNFVKVILRLRQFIVDVINKLYGINVQRELHNIDNKINLNTVINHNVIKYLNMIYGIKINITEFSNIRNYDTKFQYDIIYEIVHSINMFVNNKTNENKNEGVVEITDFSLNKDFKEIDNIVRTLLSSLPLYDKNNVISPLFINKNGEIVIESMDVFNRKSSNVYLLISSDNNIPGIKLIELEVNKNNKSDNQNLWSLKIKNESDKKVLNDIKFSLLYNKHNVYIVRKKVGEKIFIIPV